MAWADFPKSKIYQKNGPKYWCGPKRLLKYQKSHFWIDLNKYCLILPKRLMYFCLKKILPCLEPDLRMSQAFKITPLWVLFCWLHHFSKAISHQGRQCTDHKIPRVTPTASVQQERWGKQWWSWEFGRRDRWGGLYS